MRKIVQVKTIDKIVPIENADAIEAAVIGGWTIVIKKDEFTVGDSVLYFEIDSFLPGDVPEFEFLLARGTKVAFSPLKNESVEGHVLKTARLRGVFSQGLVLPLGWSLTPDSTQDDVDAVMNTLGVFKWEAPVPAGGQQVGPFPGYVQKTDSERVQNLTPEFFSSLNRDEWFATEKIDGTSATFVKSPDGEFIMCSRNWALDPQGTHAHAEIARRYDLESQMPVNSTIQGEIFGQGIQDDPLKVHRTEFRVFHMEGIDSESTLGQAMADITVPVLPWTLPESIEKAVEQVYKMKSSVNTQVQAEGVVWWHKDNKRFAELEYRSNFKAINNGFLLKHGG